MDARGAIARALDEYRPARVYASKGRGRLARKQIDIEAEAAFIARRTRGTRRCVRRPNAAEGLAPNR